MQTINQTEEQEEQQKQNGKENLKVFNSSRRPTGTIAHNLIEREFHSINTIGEEPLVAANLVSVISSI